MSNNVSQVDPDGLAEFSVVFTDRSLNHMSAKFQDVMRSLSSTLKAVYNANHVVLVPGGGTFAMEAVARQFCQDANVLIIRNGWFSYRWTQILEAEPGWFKNQTVLNAFKPKEGTQEPFRPVLIESAVESIVTKKPNIVLAPHVETSSGILIPNDYIREIAKAAHSVGALLVIDCIASGCAWLDMQELGVDILISAPQKGWSSSPCAGIVMMNDTAKKRMEETDSNSFSLNLKIWSNIMAAYENGGHAYHATMPTDAITKFKLTVDECAEIGFEKLKEAQFALGKQVRDMLTQRGIRSVAAVGFEAPGVVVSYTDNPAIQNGSAFASNGMQIAAGVPLQCDEPDDFKTFRLGLFGLDKLNDIPGTVGKLSDTLDKLGLN